LKQLIFSFLRDVRYDDQWWLIGKSVSHNVVHCSPWSWPGVLTPTAFSD